MRLMPTPSTMNTPPTATPPPRPQPAHHDLGELPKAPPAPQGEEKKKDEIFLDPTGQNETRQDEHHGQDLPVPEDRPSPDPPARRDVLNPLKEVAGRTVNGKGRAEFDESG